MNLMDWIAHPAANFRKTSDLIGICLKDASRFDECDQIWATVGIALGIVLLLVLAFIVRHFLREYAAHNRYRRKKLAELEVAPEDVMKENVWSGDNALEVGLTQEQMIQKIKEAKARQRMESAKGGAGRSHGGTP